MKKLSKKLNLNRETLRRLYETKELVQVKAGAEENQSISCVFCRTVPDHSC